MSQSKRLAAFMIVCLFVLPLTSCVINQSSSEFSQIAAICELATLKGYYHNVATVTAGEKSLFRLGYKKLWLEYSGVVTVGVDVSKVIASKPNKDGLIEVTMPKAQVLQVDFDEYSIAETVDKNLFTGFSAKERTNALALAQADMERTARENVTLMMQGQQRAKKVIESYIRSVGNAMGKSYAVKWVDVD